MEGLNFPRLLQLNSRYSLGELRDRSTAVHSAIRSQRCLWLLATRIARHSRVYSSIIVRIRSVLPSCVIPLTKS